MLVFEAPNEFEFAVQAGQKVRVGQKLGDVPPRPEGNGSGSEKVKTKED